MTWTHDEALALVRRTKLVAILRGVPMERVPGVVRALVDGGVRVLEFTFDHGAPDCVARHAEKIRWCAQEYGDRVAVGCGTALSVEEVEAAKEAGACLVITPNVNPEVIARARALDMVAMPGALTPTEIEQAYRLGADIVKLFPPHERRGRREAGKRRGLPGCRRLRLRRRRAAGALRRGEVGG